MNLKYILPILLMVFQITSCSKDSIATEDSEKLIKIQTLTNTTHTIELFNSNGKFSTGYNEITLRIKDKTSNTYVNNATMSWNPIMEMTMMKTTEGQAPSMSHSCPNSEITESSSNAGYYEGFIIFQMTNLDGSGWTLNISYTINDVTYTASETIIVNQSTDKNVTTFTGSDNVKYIIAYIEPETPKIGINHLHLGLYKMESMMSFPAVENYTIALDPRMPDMGNHSSPNNTNLTYSSYDKLYHGNLSLTMTGYWVLNLKLLNTENTVLKGEDVTTENPESSLNLNLEF